MKGEKIENKLLIEQMCDNFANIQFLLEFTLIFFEYSINIEDSPFPFRNREHAA